MLKFLTLAVSGLVTGSIYSMMSAGLVLTYEASGVFNFAHAAMAFTSAYFYYQLNTGQHIPIVPSLVITVFIFAPLMGFALQRWIFSRLATAPVYARIVGTIGVLIALPNFCEWLISALLNGTLKLNVPDLSQFGSSAGFNPPGIGPTPPKVFHLSWIGLPRLQLTSDQLAVFVVAVLAAGALYLIIRRTRLGLQMRSQVDRSQLAALRGINPDRTSGTAWIMSAVLAGLGGVLIAPLFQLDSDTFTLIVFASLAAVAVAGVRSIPIACAGGLALGIVQNLLAGYSTTILPHFLSQLTGLQSSVPYVILIVALLVMGGPRFRAAGSVSDERPAPDHRAGLPSWRRKLPWTVVTVVLVLYTLGVLPWPGNASFVLSDVVAPGLALSIVFLSFVVVTGIGGMISLAQASFATAGGFIAGWALQTTGAPHPPPWANWHSIPLLLHDGHLNFVVACVLAALGTAVVGILIALVVRHMGALEFALATFALAWVLYLLVFQNNGISNSSNGYSFTAPVLNLFGIHTFDFSQPKDMVILLLILFGLITLLIHNLQRSPSGRAMYAVRSSSVAAQTTGISPARAQVALFALSAAIAGFGGVLYGVTTFTITSESAPPLIGLTWLAVVVTFGIRRQAGAFLAGVTYSAGTVIFHEISTQSWMPSAVDTLITSPYFLPMLIGLGAVNLAKNPDGVLAMVGHDRIEKRRARARGAQVAAAESVLHRGDAGPAPVPGAAVSSRPALVVVPEQSTAGSARTGAVQVVTPRLLFEEVTAGYGDAEVLHGISLAVEAGQILSLLGANGAGKSTLCNTAAGAVALTGGHIFVSGTDISATPSFSRVRHGLLVIPEARGVFPGLTVEENLAVLLREPALREKACERFPVLRTRRKELAGSLSGGEQQMLSLAPALARPPAALIADEPTLGLAPLAAEVVLDALRELRELGTAILLVEEKASEVLKVTDTVAFMELGRLVWTGPRSEIDEHQLAAVYLGRAE